MDEDGGTDRAGTDVFALVGNETRAAALRALAEARREGAYPLGFTELRRRAGVRDSGNFNYHLDRLVGTLLERTDGEYRLSYLGERVVGLLLAGTHREHRASVTASEPCRYCGTTLSGTFEDGVLLLHCAEGHFFEAHVPPGAAAERSTTGLLALAARTLRADLDHVFDGTCPYCFGVLTLSAEARPGEYGPGVVYRAPCDRCGHTFTAPPELSALRHPAVIAFYHEQGVDVRSVPAWSTELGTVTGAVSTDPVRVTVSLAVDGARLSVTLDGDGEVVSVAEGEDGEEGGSAQS